MQWLILATHDDSWMLPGFKLQKEYSQINKLQKEDPVNCL